jgi:uncharacterized RDD family membrane protein YckC
MLCSKCGKETDASGKFCQWCGAEIAPQLKAAATTVAAAPADPEEGVQTGKPAGLGRRFLAFIVDAIFIGIIMIFATGIFGFTDSILNLCNLALGLLHGTPMAEMLGTGSLTQVLTPIFIAITVLFVIIPWIYYAVLECSRNQATLGKIALRLVVTDMQRRRITFARASLRHFAKILSVLIVFIGFIMIALTRRHQGLHDRIAGCLVFVQG